MKKISFIYVLALVTAFSLNAEIKDKEVLTEFFTGCVEESDETFDSIFSVGDQYEYCGCTTNEISKNLTFEELLQLGVQTFGASEEEILLLTLANEKLMSAATTCVGKLLNQ